MTAAPYINRWALYQLLCGISGLCLLGTTAKLWLPGKDFPDIPLLPFAHLVTHSESFATLDYVTANSVAFAKLAFFAMMVVGLIALALYCWIKKPIAVFLVMLYPVGLLASVLLNQHCLQPWAILLLALCLLASLSSTPTLSANSQDTLQATNDIRKHPISWARGLVIGIYLWSAFSKLDAQFAYTVGTQMMQILFRVLPNSLVPQDPHWLACSALCLPLGEFLAAMLLVFPRTRRLGVIVAIAMHGTLLGVLGPWGLHHKAAVLIWNATFLCQAYLLFWPTSPAKTPPAKNSQSAASPIRRLTAKIPAVVIVTMMVMPLFERWGYWDHWPSWALYAPHSSRVSLAIPSDSVDQLPSSLRAIIRAQSPHSDTVDETHWVDVPLAQWSLQSLEVPIYPQSRFQVAVAISLLTSPDPPRNFRVTVTSAANRWNGIRSTRTLYSLDELFATTQHYWLGALPLKPSPIATD